MAPQHILESIAGLPEAAQGLGLVGLSHGFMQGSMDEREAITCSQLPDS